MRNDIGDVPLLSAHRRVSLLANTRPIWLLVRSPLQSHQLILMHSASEATLMWFELKLILYVI